jgi:hypothetical protein
MPYEYRTCCVHSTYELINAMRESSQSVTYRTFRKHVPDANKLLGYEGTGLHLKRDWHVAFYKGMYAGTPCYYVVHSAIEYIWTKG